MHREEWRFLEHCKMALQMAFIVVQCSEAGWWRVGTLQLSAPKTNQRKI